MPSLRSVATDEADPLAWMRETVFAHRGLHGVGLAENSPSAFAAAIARGFGIECDIRKSRNGRAIVFHDETLERLTEETGPMGALGVGDLTAIRLKGSDDTIPTLRDLLEQVAGAVPLLLEIKSDGVRPISPLCRAVASDLEGYRGPVAVMSFDPRVSAWFARKVPAIAHGLVATEQDRRTLVDSLRRRFAIRQSRAQFLAWDIRDLPSPLVERQRKRGRPVLTWTVRDTAQWDTARACHAAPIAEGPVLENRGAALT